MNKFKALDINGNHVIGGPSTGWAYTDAYRQRKCPKCGSDPGYHCEGPAGKRAVWPPHSARVVIGPEHRVQTTSFQDILKKLQNP